MRDLRDIFWTSVPHSWLLKVRKLCGKFLRKILFPPRMRPGYDLFNFKMDKKLADWVKIHSVEKPHTNRALATLFKKTFPKSNIEEGCQIEGQWLKDYASNFLKVDFEELCEKSPEYHKSIEESANIIRKILKDLSKHE